MGSLKFEKLYILTSKRGYSNSIFTAGKLRYIDSNKIKVAVVDDIKLLLNFN